VRVVERIAVHDRAAADTGPREHDDVVEVADPLDAEELQLGLPGELPDVPVRLGQILVAPALACLHDADPIALFDRAHGSDAATEAGADDDYVVVEAIFRHQYHHFNTG
jgi:hypothetical protein